MVLASPLRLEHDVTVVAVVASPFLDDIAVVFSPLLDDDVTRIIPLYTSRSS